VSAAVRAVPIVLVAAVAENGVIGRAGKLPWRIRSDLQYFKSLTLSRPIVMGRKTFESIGRPLSGRTNIVVSRDRDFAIPGVVVAPSVEKALETARGDALRRGADSIAIIGGTDIFALTMPMAERLALTIVHASPEGDTHFPVIDPRQWREVERLPQKKGPHDEYGFSFVTYRRVGAA
jgi:dihydrofolate reductase